MWNLEKWYRWTYFQDRNRDRGQTCEWEGSRSRMTREAGAGTHTLPCVKSSLVGACSNSTGSSAQCSVMPAMRGKGWGGKGVQAEGIYVHTELIHFVAQQKPAILESKYTSFFFFFNKMVMLLKYRWFTVLLVSGIQSDPFYILIFFRFFRLFSTIGYYKILSSLCLLLIYFIYSSLYLWISTS